MHTIFAHFSSRLSLRIVLCFSWDIFLFVTQNSLGDFMLIILIRTVLLYAFVTFAVRIMGKRQVSDMTTSELVITLIISDVASIPMQNTAQPLISGFVPILVFVAIEIIVSVIMMKNKRFRKLICGSPVVVIENGKINEKALSSLRITYEDLDSLLRQQEVFDVTDVKYGIMETNGNLSILKKEEKQV